MHHLHVECTMADLMVRCVERGGDRTAFISHGRSTTYRDFGRRLSQLVQALEQRGFERGDGFACLSANSTEAYLVQAAAYMLGARVTNMHPMASLDDHAFILDDCQADAFFFDPDHHGDRVADLRDRLGSGVTLLALGTSALAPDVLAEADACPPAPLVPKACVDDICWLLYTGGTTGKPKGVIHTHRTHMAMAYAELSEWEWPERVVFLAITPISHGAGGCIVPTLLQSGTVVMENGFSAEKFFTVVARDGVTSSFLVPTMIYKLLDHTRDHRPDFSTLALMIYGAAPMAPARMMEAQQVFGSIFMQLYGQSEAPNALTILRKCDHDASVAHRLGSCGLPIYNSQVAVLDDDCREVPVGETGEICARGPLVMQGYWNRPDETEKAFKGGWLHTGDLARRDADGYIYIIGRSKDMIISGGFNVYPAEIEDVLTAHPAIFAAAVVGVADATWGEAVKAVVVLKPGASVSEAEVIACVRQAKGAVYAPKSVDFVESLPTTSLGKPDKKALRERYAAAET